MATTPNYNLPLIPDNAVNNIKRDFNSLSEAVDSAMKTAVEGVDIPLSDATNGTRSNVAGSEKAVGDVMKEAQAAKTLGNERKQQAVDALIAWGVSASMADSWDTLFLKMTAIIKATGNATATDVLAGKTFSNASGNGLQGAMPNRGAGGTVTPGTTNQTKAAGYYNSPITVLGDADLVPANIRSGVDLFGVLGALEPKIYYESRLPNMGPESVHQLTLPFTPKILLLYGTRSVDYQYYDQSTSSVFASPSGYVGGDNPRYPYKTFYASGSSGNDGYFLSLARNSQGESFLAREDELTSNIYYKSLTKLFIIFNVTVKAWG